MSKELEDNDVAAEVWAALSSSDPLTAAQKAAILGLLGAETPAGAQTKVTALADLVWPEFQYNSDRIDTKIGRDEIVDNLNSTANDAPLSAIQGKVLRTLIESNISPASIWAKYLEPTTLTSADNEVSLDVHQGVNGYLAMSEDTEVAIANVGTASYHLGPGVTGNIWVTNSSGWELSVDGGIVDEGDLADISTMAATDLAQLTYVYTPTGKFIWRLAIITGGNA